MYLRICFNGYKVTDLEIQAEREERHAVCCTLARMAARGDGLGYEKTLEDICSKRFCGLSILGPAVMLEVFDDKIKSSGVVKALHLIIFSSYLLQDHDTFWRVCCT